MTACNAKGDLDESGDMSHCMHTLGTERETPASCGTCCSNRYECVK